MGGTVLSSYVYTYYASGNQRSKADNFGKVTTYVYDDAGRLTNDSDSDSGGQTISYGYDRFMLENDNGDYHLIIGRSRFRSSSNLDTCILE